MEVHVHNSLSLILTFFHSIPTYIYIYFFKQVSKKLEQL